MSITWSREEWWRDLSRDVSSRRYTTSSRQPGAVRVGTVHHRSLGLATCEKCGRLRYDMGGPHAPHWNAAMQRVDCSNQPVQPVAPKGTP